MGARRAAVLALVALAGALAAVLLLRGDRDPAPPPPEQPAGEPVSVPGVQVLHGRDEIVARNGDGEWTVRLACAGDRGRTVGPGYVSRFVTVDGAVLVDDMGPSAPLNDPGFGGLGAFAWHHARGQAGELRLGHGNAWEVSGRDCAEANDGFGVSAARLLEAPGAGTDELGERFVGFAVEIELSDEWTYPRPLVRLRYRYRVHRDAVRSWIAVTQLCPEGRCGDTDERAFVKEPKLAAGVRSDRPLPYRRAAIFDDAGELRCIYVSGGPPTGPVLDTGQCAHPARTRVRFDAGTATSGAEGGCDGIPCLEVTMRAHPAEDGDVVPAAESPLWQGAGAGLDAWAEAAATRPAALESDTGSVDGLVWDCHGGDPAGELQRRWETIARLGHDGGHRALSVLFTAWQGGRGGYDCEPLLRTFGPDGETWGAFATYSLG